MKLLRNLSRVICVALVVLGSATLNAQTYVYEAVPYELTDMDTGDLYTIGGTFTTDCVECFLGRDNLLSFDITVDGPFPFNFTPDSIDPNVLILSGFVSATEISLFYSGEAVILIANNPNNSLIWQNFNVHTVQYSNDNTVASFVEPSTDPLVFATLVPACDFNGDGNCDIDDIDALIMVVAAGTNDPIFDLNGDSLVNLEDRDEWLAAAGAENLPSGNPYLVADFNLDGFVDGTDFIGWNANRFSDTGKWSLADANADGVTDGQDFIEWNDNRFMSSDGVAAVPEPGTGILLIAVVVWLAVVRRR